MDDVHLAKDNVADKITNMNNVVGAAVGVKWVDGKPTTEPSILVFVEEKLSDSNIISKYSPDDIIPKYVDGIPTDVIEIGKLTKHITEEMQPQILGFREKVRPIKPGYSCSHSKVTAGTIGGFFIDRDGDQVILSNCHVLANEGNAAIGDSIIQPGSADDGTETIARLKSFIPLLDNVNQDSAIAKVLDSHSNLNLQYPIINSKIKGFAKAEVGSQVQKCGRTTGYTVGKVLGVNGTFTVGYDLGLVKLNDCIITTKMSGPGDSGSLILDMNMNAVGLIFGGSDKISIASNILNPVSSYGLKIWNSESNKLKTDFNQWAKFGNGISIDANNIVTITNYANNAAYLQQDLYSFNSVSCKVNTGTDKAATWGPCLAVCWPGGMLKVNIRYGSHFGGYYNTCESISIGHSKPNTEYELRISSTGTTFKGEVGDNGQWVTVIEIPANVFPNSPTCVRIGKTDSLCNLTNHSDAGEIGSCSFSDFKYS